jgi:TIR domain
MLFFSYSRGNLLVVRSVAAELRRLGYRTWLDLESLRPGERWREAIERAMAASEAMVFCISRLSLESAWTSVELRAALERGLPVVPLLIDDVAIAQLPPTLRELHLICTTGWAAHELPAQAALAIARSVGRSAPPESWSIDDTGTALRVEVAADGAGEVTLGWTYALWNSPPAPLVADSLSELARAADEARAAELHIGPQVEPAVAALVLGTLAARLGPARVRLHTGTSMALALADVAQRMQAKMADPPV